MEYNRFIQSVYLLVCIIIGAQAASINSCDGSGSQSNILRLMQERKVVDSYVNANSYQQVGTLPNRFETSDVVLRHDGRVAFAVFDNSYHIGAFCTPYGRTQNCTDKLLAWPDASVATKKSGFEGIAYNPVHNTYYVAQEALATSAKKVFRANVFEIRIDFTQATPIRLIESCIVNWNFGSENKGVEGLEFVHHHGTGRNFLLGLCEANECNHKSTLDNQGRIIVLEKRAATGQNACSWEPVGTLALPQSVHFDDYSAVSINHQPSTASIKKIAVSSQEMSQVWVGVIGETNRAPFFSLSSTNTNDVYDLPRIDVARECKMNYCNIEGVAWKGENELILASDKAKDDQDAECLVKEQSLHYFSLP